MLTLLKECCLFRCRFWSCASTSNDTHQYNTQHTLGYRDRALFLLFFYIFKSSIPLSFLSYSYFSSSLSLYSFLFQFHTLTLILFLPIFLSHFLLLIPSLESHDRYLHLVDALPNSYIAYQIQNTTHSLGNGSASGSGNGFFDRTYGQEASGISIQSNNGDNREGRERGSEIDVDKVNVPPNFFRGYSSAPHTAATSPHASRTNTFASVPTGPLLSPSDQTVPIGIHRSPSHTEGSGRGSVQGCVKGSPRGSVRCTAEGREAQAIKSATAAIASLAVAAVKPRTIDAQGRPALQWDSQTLRSSPTGAKERENKVKRRDAGCI